MEKDNMLKIYNTLHKKKEAFKPLKGKKVRFFVCGPTVYDYSHIGHARTYIIFDAFAKYLRKKGYNVFYLQNITDLDDKIIAKAKEKGLPPQNIALFFEKDYLNNMKILGVDGVTKYAKATKYIKKIISQTKRLMDKGYAYQANDGVYYDISKFKNYGKLSGRTIAQGEDSLSRIDENKDKRNKGDFCLWKLSKEGEPSWKSPWGNGRPGWHIEDTAITEKFFGSQYDIHGGARDLIFPHHEAEISQMEAVSNKSPMVKYWMHAGFLTIDGQKMSKSLGNYITINKFLEKYPSRYLRFLVIKNLWRSPIDYSEKGIIEIEKTLEKIEEFLIKLKRIAKEKIKNKGFSAFLKKSEKEFYNRLDDDFNTPKALAVIFNIIKETNKLFEKNKVGEKEAKEILRFFKEANEILGIIDFNKINKKLETPYEVKRLIEDREKCRKEKNWQKADEIRKQIEKLGFQIEDTDKGPMIK